MTSPVPGESTIYLYPSRGSLRFRCGNTSTERPIFQTCGHGETDEDIVTRNSRRGSKFVSATTPAEAPIGESDAASFHELSRGGFVRTSGHLLLLECGS